MKKFIVILSGVCLLFIPYRANAGQVSFHPAEQLAHQEQPYTTTLVLNTEGESINTVEGLLKVDSGLIQGENQSIEISDSGSIITYWVVRPQYDSATGVIRFAGGVPGGYSGTTGILFSIILPPYSGEPIDRAINLTELHAYKNDGVATSANITTANFSLGDIAGEVDPTVSEQLYLNGNRKDDIPPEVFSPQISQDPNVFEGKWFINFSTVDKQSGIDHYEIQETRTGSLDAGKWITPVTSPYELQDQALHSFVYVVAVDRQGNERIIKVFPRNPLSWTQLYGKQIFGIIVIAVAVALIYWRRRRNKNKNLLNGSLSS